MVVEKFSRLCRKFVRVIGILLIGYLFLQGLFTICCIQRVSENTYFIRNNVFSQILGILLFIFGVIGLQHSKVQDFLGKYGRAIVIGLLVLMTGFLIFWIVETQFWYCSDMEAIFHAAARFHEGDYIDWQPGGYLYMWSHQNGLFLLVAFLLKFFSMGASFSIFYGINICFYVITVVALWHCVSLLFDTPNVNVIQAIMLICYLPYGFFCTFMYGNIIGFGFACVAMEMVLLYIRRQKLWGLICAAISMLLAISFKQNVMIVLVGILIVLVFDCLENRDPRWKKTVAILGFVVLVLVGTKIPDVLVEQMTGVELSDGNSKWAHVAMGLQGKEMRPGWFNGYNEEVFKASNYDKEATSSAALENIMITLEEFAKEPEKAWSFFNYKLASEWNNPTFECFNIQNARKTSLELSSLVKSTINDGGKINIIFIYVFDIIQSILLFGIFLYLVSAEKADWGQLLFCLLFIGGFIFFAFWEAKSQYVLPFFFFLIPYSYLGYVELVKRMLAKEKWNVLYTGVTILAALIIVIAVADGQWVQNSFKIHANTDAYYEYIHQYNQNFVGLKF